MAKLGGRRGFDKPRGNSVLHETEVDLPELDPDYVYLVIYQVFGINQDCYTSATDRYKSDLLPYIRKKHKLMSGDELKFVEFKKETLITK